MGCATLALPGQVLASGQQVLRRGDTVMHEIPIRSFAVSVVALRQTEQRADVLLLKRTQSLAGTWCQVAGAIEAEETAWQAALRELYEETGLRPQSLYSADICEQFYEAHRDAISILPVFVAFIHPTAQVLLNHEHSDAQWVSFDAAYEMVEFGGQRRVLRWIEAEFVNRAPSAHLRVPHTPLQP